MGLGENPPGVLVLYNESLNLIKGEPHDMLAEHGVIACATAVAEALSENYKVIKVPVHTDIELALSPYPPTDWFVFNLGEGVEGRLFEAARIAWALDALGYTFTGAGGNTIANTTHKHLAKQYLAQAHLPTPTGWVFRDPREVSGDYPYPLIVKPVAEDGSLGITADSVVHDREALLERVGYVIECYRQAALVEQFVKGREFNISIWGKPPEVLPLDEIDFSDIANPCNRIVSFAAKWEVDSFDYNHTPGMCPAHVGVELGQRISAIALGAWHALACEGYARIDIRVDQDGNPYIVEINCNPDLSPEAGFYRAARTAGYSYPGMVTKIAQMAYNSNPRFCRSDSTRGKE